MQNYERVFPHLAAVVYNHAHFGFIYPFTEISITEISAPTLKSANHWWQISFKKLKSYDLTTIIEAFR